MISLEGCREQGVNQDAYAGALGCWQVNVLAKVLRFRLSVNSLSWVTTTEPCFSA